MIEKIKKNWIFVLFIIPFILICFVNKEPDNDIWFLLNNGRYVLQNGIPFVDTFTIHEGLNYVMQQWASASIFWLIYDTLGKYGLLVLVYVMSFLLMYVFYKLCETVTNKKNISVIITAITLCLVRRFIVLRPQIFTYLILLLEILLLELYIKKQNKKYLYFFPILSILLINLHASMWYFQFVFMLPFLLNSINIPKITKDKIEIKPVIIVALIMFLCGFINPYGYEAVTFIFKSYGIDSFNEIISEMKAPTFSVIYFKIILGCLFLLICLINFLKKEKLDIRHFLFICGVSILGFMHIKCFPYFVFIYFYVLSYLIKNMKFDFKFLNKKVIKAINNGLIIGISVFLVISFGITCVYSFKYYNFSEGYVEDIVDYIEENYNKDEVRLYVGFNYGGYTEYRGLKSYIDGRAELFIKKLNNKSDIFDEFVKIRKNDDDAMFEEFLDKYKFTHLIINAIDEENFDKYLEKNGDYEIVYIQYFDPDTKDLPYRKLYVLKDLEG